MQQSLRKFLTQIKEIIAFHNNFCEGPIHCGHLQPNYCESPDHSHRTLAGQTPVLG